MVICLLFISYLFPQRMRETLNLNYCPGKGSCKAKNTSFSKENLVFYPSWRMQYRTLNSLLTSVQTRIKKSKNKIPPLWGGGCFTSCETVRIKETTLMSLMNYLADVWELGDTVSQFMTAVTKQHNKTNFKSNVQRFSTHMNSQSLAYTRNMHLHKS